MGKKKKDEVEELQAEIIKKVSELTAIASEGATVLDLEAARKQSYINEARTKRAFLDGAVRGRVRRKQNVADYQEKF